MRLMLSLLEGTDLPRRRFAGVADAGHLSSKQESQGNQRRSADKRLTAEWRLARTAIDALAYGVKKCLAIQANRETEAAPDLGVDLSREATRRGDLVSGDAAADVTAGIGTRGSSAGRETDAGIEATVRGTSVGDTMASDPADGLIP